MVIYAFGLPEDEPFEEDQQLFEGGRSDVLERGEVEAGGRGDKLGQQPQ